LLRLDWTKAATQLGWNPTFPLLKGIAETVNWYKAAYDGMVSFEQSIGYIDRFVEAAKGIGAPWVR
jgi:dTDP-D-glucose 4,6-dehydratase